MVLGLGLKRQHREGGGQLHTADRSRRLQVRGRRSRQRRRERRTESSLSSAVRESQGPAPLAQESGHEGRRRRGRAHGATLRHPGRAAGQATPAPCGSRVPDASAPGHVRSNAVACPHPPARQGPCARLSVTLRVVIMIRGPGTTSRDLRAGGERRPSAWPTGVRRARGGAGGGHERWKRQVGKEEAVGTGRAVSIDEPRCGRGSHGSPQSAPPSLPATHPPRPPEHPGFHPVNVEDGRAARGLRTSSERFREPPHSQNVKGGRPGRGRAVLGHVHGRPRRPRGCAQRPLPCPGPAAASVRRFPLTASHWIPARRGGRIKALVSQVWTSGRRRLQVTQPGGRGRGGREPQAPRSPVGSRAARPRTREDSPCSWAPCSRRGSESGGVYCHMMPLLTPPRELCLIWVSRGPGRDGQAAPGGPCHS